jgi:hypothetical protein
MQLKRLTPILFLAALAATGCLFSPDKKAPPKKTPIVYPPRRSPQEALEFMKAAYEDRDSAQTFVIYDVNYQGTSTDPSAPIPVSNFTRADEVRHVGALKLSLNVTSVRLDLGPSATWVRLPPDAADPPEWAVIQINSGKVEISDVDRGVTYEAASNPMTYTFKPTPDPAAPGDSIWTIVKWTEFAK